MRQLRSFALLRRKPAADSAEQTPDGEMKTEVPQPISTGGEADDADAIGRAGFKAVEEAIENASAVVNAAARELASIDQGTAPADALQQAVEQSKSIIVPATVEGLTAKAPVVEQKAAPAPLGLTAAMDVASEKLREAMSCARSANWTVADLADAAKEIAAMMDVVSSVARQTTLLALNVTIEAARAGEAGMGFADVANGVKSLSLETSRAARDICIRVARLRDSVDSSMGSMERAVSMLEGVQPILGEVRSAVSQQTTGAPRLPKVTGLAALIRD